MQQKQSVYRAALTALTLSLALLSQNSFAALLSQQFEQSIYGSRPRTLVMGRSIMGMRTDVARTSQRLNSKGSAEKMGGSFVEKFSTSEGTFSRKYQVDATYVQMTPFWGYGLDRKLSLYASLPIYQITTSTRQIVTKESDEVVTPNKLSAKKRQFVQSPKDGDQQLIVGQATLAAQYTFDDRGDLKTALTSKIRIPTGDRNDLSYFTQGVPDAQGFGVGGGLVNSAWIGKGWELLTAVEGTVNFSDRIYVSDEESQNLEQISRDPGETAMASAMLDKEIIKHSHLLVGYSYEHKWEDILSDESVAAGTEESSGERLHIAYAYRPPNFLTSDRAISRIQTKLSYSHLLNGENILDGDTAALELSVSY